MIDRLRELGINVKYGSSGDVKVLCPRCSATRKNKTEPCLSVNVDRGLWQCHNCDFKGGIVTAPKVQKEYIKPSPELKTLSQPVIDWFASRGITNQTLLRYKISEGVDYMPQVNAEVKTIHFNYIYNGEVVNIKFRDRDKNFKLVSGAMLCPFGIDVCLDNLTDSVVFVEGEMDALSYYEAGIKAVVSVPNGASKGTQKMEWLDDFIHLFEGKKIYLSCDMDDAGISLRNELARRFGRENCLIVNLPHKDANEVLIKMGKDTLVECINSATQFPIEGIDDASSVRDELMSLYENGTPKGYDIGYGMLWHPGQVTLITGIPGHGKSTFVKNVIFRLAAMHGLKSFVYSAEEANTAFALADMVQIATGKSFFHSDNRALRSEIEEVMPFLENHFKYYRLSENDLTIDAILDKARQMVKQIGINVVVIDNMSTVEKSMSNQTDTRHHQIKNMMNDVARFARLNDVHVILVAHPKKMSELKTGVYKVPNGYDVGDCYSEDTEVLTEKGWMLHSEWNGERIAMFNADTNEIEMDYPEVLNKFQYKGEMHHYESKMYDVLVTPNHRMVVKPSWNTESRLSYSDGWSFIESSNLSKSVFSMPSCAHYTFNDDVSQFVEGYDNVLLARLCGYYTSEGYYSSNSFCISQQPGKVADDMENTIKGLGLKYSRRVKVDKRGYKDNIVFRIYKRGQESIVNWIFTNCGTMSYGVKVPTVFISAPKDVRDAFLNAHVDGDGCIDGYMTIIDSTSKVLVDGLSALAVTLGYRVSNVLCVSKKPNHRDQYRIRMRRDAPFYSMDTAAYRRTVDYEGMTYCFTTKTGAYVTRRNGKVSFQGNSSHWYNLPDNGLTVYRNFETRQTEVHRWKVRFRYTGEVGHSCFFYNLNSNTFTPDVESKSKFVGQPNKEQVQRFSQLADPF